MAYNDHYGSQGGGGFHRGNDRRSELPEKLNALTVPQEYVEKAEEVIRSIKEGRSQITTSKLRNLLTLVTDVFNVEQLEKGENLLPESIAKLQMMRVRVVYEAGRDRDTETFVKEAKLIQYLKGIGNSRENLLRFAHYMEALVAYHRFYHVGNER